MKVANADRSHEQRRPDRLIEIEAEHPELAYGRRPR
jgi:hypothetical protein